MWKTVLNQHRTKAGLVFVVTGVILGNGILLGVLLAWRPGKPEPFLDANGDLLVDSISEKIYVTINGACKPRISPNR